MGTPLAPEAFGVDIEDLRKDRAALATTDWLATTHPHQLRERIMQGLPSSV